MFKDAYSAYQLLCSSQMIVDMAFVRAVIAASAWLGPGAMPVGYIDSWPPPEGEEGLRMSHKRGAMSHKHSFSSALVISNGG